jgi:hypothetical protein
VVQATHYPLIVQKIIKVTETAIIIFHNPYASSLDRPSPLIFEIPPLKAKIPLFNDEDLPGADPVLAFANPETTFSWCKS